MSPHPPEWLAKLVSHSPQLLFLGVLIFLFVLLRESNSGSKFKKREAERGDLDRILNQGPDLAQAKLKRPRTPTGSPPPPPLALPGITLAGEAHEILGVPEDADEMTIQKAYKEAIKRYHPDRIQGISGDQMKFYQEASARLTDAKNELLRRLKNR
jgi:DnaJ-domain-containing protein 1